MAGQLMHGTCVSCSAEDKSETETESFVQFRENREECARLRLTCISAGVSPCAATTTPPERHAKKHHEGNIQRNIRRAAWAVICANPHWHTASAAEASTPAPISAQLLNPVRLTALHCSETALQLGLLAKSTKTACSRQRLARRGFVQGSRYWGALQ